MKQSEYSLAIALEYNQESNKAPLLSAKEEQRMADEVVKIARRFGIPVVENDELASALSVAKEETEIPEELYEAVAILIHELEHS